MPYFFVNYTCEAAVFQSECLQSGDTIIARFRVGTNGVVDTASRRPLLVIPQPFSNHNAGDLKFGPDGNLWIPMGDGGSGNDPACFAQRDDSLLGKLLRIDVNQNVNTPPYYGIPAGNPYIGAGGPADEVFARGLRNPFRFSFDRLTGDMFIGDVGQGAREEIDFQAAGTGAAANYGWKVMEGTLCLGDGGTCPVGTPPCNSPAYTPPIIEVDHSTGDCAIIGGFRYRGTAMPALAGRYFHSDNCTGRIRAATETSPGVWSDTVLLDTSENISGFGEDEAGELYVTALGGSVYRIRAAGAGAGLSVGDVDVNPEGNAGNTNAVFTVTLGTASAQTVTVQYATAPGGATAPADYLSASGTLTFAPSTTTRTVTVAVVGDTLDEANEGFFVNLSNPVNAVLNDPQGVGTIFDDDPLPVATVSGCTVAEGNSGVTPCTFDVTLSPASGRTVLVDYATADGTAQFADYGSTAGTVTFPAGATSASAVVPVLGDVLFEPDETFLIALQGGVNVVAGGSATNTIVNDDARLQELAHGMTVRGNLAGPLPVLFRFSQDANASYEVVLDEAAGDAVPGLRLDRVFQDGALLLQPSVDVGTGSARSLSWQSSGLGTDLELIRVGSPACGTACGPDDTYRLRAYETTGRIARFNNSGTQVTVLIVQNVTDLTIQARVFFWGTGGALITSTPITLAPKALSVLQTAGFAAGGSGSISIAHDAPYGALAAKGVALEPATGFSFDTPMTYRSR